MRCGTRAVGDRAMAGAAQGGLVDGALNLAELHGDVLGRVLDDLGEDLDGLVDLAKLCC